jgi:hypothetical protein
MFDNCAPAGRAKALIAAVRSKRRMIMLGFLKKVTQNMDGFPPRRK